MALKFYTSYLAERMQTFQVKTYKLKTSAINCSVRQGSVLGPLKFIEYTKNLPSVVEEYIFLRRRRSTQRSSFAVRRQCRYTRDGELCGCCAQMVRPKCLQLNPSKTQVIWFGTNANL